MATWAHTSLSPNDRFFRFCTTCRCARKTHRTRGMCSNEPHSCGAAKNSQSDHPSAGESHTCLCTGLIFISLADKAMFGFAVKTCCWYGLQQLLLAVCQMSNEWVVYFHQCPNAMRCDARLPSQPQVITAPSPVTMYTAWWPRHMHQFSFVCVFLVLDRNWRSFHIY